MKKLKLIVILFFCISQFVNAQDKIVFKDSVGIQGELFYSGIYSDSVLPKNGKYELRWREIDGATFKTFLVKGNTKNNQPHGTWIWEEAYWNYTIEPSATIQPDFKVYGIRYKWKGNFSEGKANGNWFLQADTILPNGKSTKPFVEISMKMENNKVVGDFSLTKNESNNYIKITGKTNKDGIADGVWKYISNLNGVDYQQEMVYQNGLIIEIKNLDKNNQEVFHFKMNQDFVQSVLQPNITVEIGDSIFHSNEFSNVLTQQYDEQINLFFEKGWKHDLFSFSLGTVKPIFLRLEFPLSNQEKEFISKMKEEIKKQRQELAPFVSKNSSLYRNFSKELNATITHLSTMNLQLETMDSLLNCTGNPYFTYKKRFHNELNDWIETINAIVSEVNLEEKILITHLAEMSAEDVDSLGLFVAMTYVLNKNKELIPQYTKIFKDSEIAMERQGILRQMEIEIIERLELLQLIYENPKGIAKQINDKWLKNRIEDELHQFTLTKEYEQAKKIGDELIEDMNTILYWSTKANEFDSMAIHLKNHYSYLAYNPYTGAYDINVPIKKRFITSVIQTLLPYLEKELAEENNWQRWKALWDQHFKVYDFLKDFVNDESKAALKLNQKVRKEKKPERILKLILNYIEDDRDLNLK